MKVNDITNKQANKPREQQHQPSNSEATVAGKKLHDGEEQENDDGEGEREKKHANNSKQLE